MMAEQELSTNTADILVVDDNIASLRMLTEILSKAGYKPRPVEDPQFALEAARAQPPSLILLDVRMPKISGFELCRRLKQDVRTRDVPIIFVSALQELGDRIQGFEVGGVDFISKPIQELEVLARVKTHLQLRDTQLHLESIVSERTAELEKLLEEILESKERYRTLFEASFDAIFFSEKGICLEQNAAAEIMLGYTLSEAIGRKGTEWIAPEDRQMVMDNMQSGYEEPYEAVALRKDGSTFPAEIQARMMQYKGRAVRVTALSDISKRKQALEALQESEEKFKTLVTNTEQIVYMVAKDGTFLLSEGKGLSKLGLKPGEVVGKSVFELYEDYPHMLDAMRNVFNGESTTTEVEVGGNHFRNWYTPHKDHQGEIIGLMGLSVNITEQKQAEQDLLESEERFRVTFEQAAVGIDHEAPGGRFLRINQKFCDIVGYSREEMLERTFQDITHPDDLDIDHENAQRMLDGQLESYSTEKRYLSKNGEIIWVNITVSLVRENKGNPNYFISVVEDITERKQAQEALQKSEKRFKDVADNALEWIWEIDNNGKYTYVSPVVESILGYKPEEILQKHFYDLFYPDEKEELKQAAFEAFASKERLREFINRNVHKNGTVVWLSTSGLPIIDERGELLGYRGADTDITERKLAEEVLKADLAYHREDLAVLVQRLSLAVKISSFGIWDWDTKENSMTWDNKLFEIYGIEKRIPLPYEDWVHLIHPDDLPAVEAMMRTVIETRSEGLLEYRIVRPDGELRHISAAGTVVLNDAGEVVKAIGINLDITERKQAGDALLESESLLRTITENYPAFLSIIEMDEKGVMTVNYVTGLDFSRLNLDPQSYIGLTIEDILEEQAPVVRENYLKAFRGEVVSFELPAGDEHLLYNVIPLIMDEPGQVARILSVVENITERKQLEAQLEQTAALEERDRLARDLHDSVTQGIYSASLIAETLPVIWEEDQEQGKRGLQQLERLTQGVLAEMRTLLLEMQPEALLNQDLPYLVRLLADTMMARGNISISTTIMGDFEAPTDVKIALYRIAQEALNNVVKHSQARSAKVYLEEDGEQIILRISDDGIGFDSENPESHGIGIGIMTKRASEIDASLSITSHSNEGTLILVKWHRSVQE